MSEVKHTPEPWMADLEDYASVIDSDGICVCEMPPYTRSPNREKARANAERIVACVNACKGINPEAVPDLLDALKEALYTLDEGNAERPEDSRYRHLWDVVFKATEPQQPPVPSA